MKTVLEGEEEDRAKCHILHRRYQSLVREYKRLERRLVECQKKQLEVPLCLFSHCRIPFSFSLYIHSRIVLCPDSILSCPDSIPLQVAQHRDIIQNEYARANLARSKLENLCRELQKHSKQVAVSYLLQPPGGSNFWPP